MDDLRFDRLAAALATGPSRRRLLAALLGSVFAGRVGQRKIKAKKKKKKKSCSAGNPIRCGRFCCRPDESCRKGKCVDHCEDGIQNFGETDVDCGGTCVGRLPSRPFGRCVLRKRCAVAGDCDSQFCEEIEPGAGQVCVECNIDLHCDANNFGRVRCIDHFCHECAVDGDCSLCCPGRPFCVAPPGVCPNRPGVTCACRECREGHDAEDCPEPGSICNDEGNCEGLACDSNADCQSGCCDNGLCADLSNDIANCGACGRSCPGAFPECVRCCQWFLRSIPKGDGPRKSMSMPPVTIRGGREPGRLNDGAGVPTAHASVQGGARSRWIRYAGSQDLTHRARSLATSPSRRRLLGTLLAAALAGIVN